MLEYDVRLALVIMIISYVLFVLWCGYNMNRIGEHKPDLKYGKIVTAIITTPMGLSMLYLLISLSYHFLAME